MRAPEIYYRNRAAWAEAVQLLANTLDTAGYVVSVGEGGVCVLALSTGDRNPVEMMGRVPDKTIITSAAKATKIMVDLVQKLNEKSGNDLSDKFKVMDKMAFALRHIDYLDDRISWWENRVPYKA